MKFRYTILYVKDVETTLEFYKNAFGLTRRMLTDEGGYAELDTGDTVLAFASFETVARKSPAPASPDAPTFELAFETDDVNAALARAVQEGAKPVQEATQMPWGQTVGYVSDPNGFLIEICTKIG